MRPTAAYLSATAAAFLPSPSSLNFYPTLPETRPVNTASPTLPSNPEQTGSSSTSLTRAEVKEMIDEKINGLKIYVLESDITQAQQAVKSIVELSSF